MPDRLLVCIGINHKQNEKIIRTGARIANRLDALWFVLYVETPKEPFGDIELSLQRHLIMQRKKI